jgi:hypothetical protein
LHERISACNAVFKGFQHVCFGHKGNGLPKRRKAGAVAWRVEKSRHALAYIGVCK